MVPKASVLVITGHETVNVSLPDGSTSQGHILMVPMPGSGVRPSVPVSQVTATSLHQDTVCVRAMQSSVETQTYKL